MKLPFLSPALLLLTAFLLVFGGAQSLAQKSYVPNDEDLADIARIEDYLNQTTTLQARFIQMASTGVTAEGDIMLWRPGRLRIVYDPPSPVVITANGTFIVFHDTELDQLTHVPLSSTPVGVLVEEEVELHGEDLAVIGIRRGANILEVSMIQREDPYAGEITLVFSDHPLRLQRWVVLDAQGVTTNFALIGSRLGVTFDPEIFKADTSPLSRKAD